MQRVSRKPASGEPDSGGDHATVGVLRASADALIDPCVLLEAVRDPSGRIVDFRYRQVNRATCEQFGLSRAELLGRGIVETSPGEKALLPGYIRCLETGEPLVVNDFCYDGQVRTAERRYDVRAARATSSSIILTWRDVTERFQMARRIADSETTYRLLVENAADLIGHVRQDATGDYRIAWISPNVEAVLGAPQEHWLGRTLLEFVAAEDMQGHADRWTKVSAGGAFSQRVRMRSADGTEHWFHVNVKPFHDTEGHPDGAVIAAHLVDEEVAAERAVEDARRQQAKADERFRRAMENAAVGMCLMTADGRVEEVNHEMCRFLGHDADTLRQKTWEDVTDPDYREENQKYITAMLAGHLDSYRIINQYVHADGHQIWGDHSVTCIRDEDGRLENFLIQVADVTPVESELRERLEFEEFLSGAITDGHLVAFAQPIVDARTGQLVEEELLVRIVGPDGRVMLPGEFLPQTQRFGMMPTIDRFMVARAIELARTGRRVAVNISAASINDATTISTITEELRQAGDAAARVSFEITEHTALGSTDLAERFSDDMRRLGCLLALDDFGTGFGSFTELRGMTVDKLKIDRSFVTDLLRNPQDESVVRAIVGIAKEFELLTTAEGVEDTETRDRLIELGVDQLQGFLIAHPEPVRGRD